MTEHTAPVHAVVGATGQQGSAVVDALLAADVRVRALVRDPAADAARTLADRGVDVVRADQEDGDAVAAGLVDVAGLFFMTTFSDSSGVAGEVRRGTSVAEAAARAGVPHVVYSSVGGAERRSGIPHFESKRRVEERLVELGLRVKFVRPVFFMDNLAQFLTPGEGEVVVALPLVPDRPLQLVAVRDIGRVAARVLLDPSVLATDGVEIVGDSRSGEQIADLVGARLGRPARFRSLPFDAPGDDDLEAMFRWFAETPAYQGDLAETQRLDPDVVDLAGWLATQPTP